MTLAVEIDPAEAGFDAERLNRIDRHYMRYVDEGKLPGFLATIARDGQLVHVASGGLRDVDARLPVESDTLWRIYSMTKPITSVAAMMLWEEGAFELKDPVSKYLPAFADARVWAGGSQNKPMTVPAQEPMRIWHLLTHTSGLTYGFHYAEPLDGVYRAHGFEFGAPAGMDLAACCDAWGVLPLLFEPGTRVQLQRLDGRARPAGRGRVRADAGRVLRAAHPRPAGHDGHRVRGARRGSARRALPTGAGAQRPASARPRSRSPRSSPAAVGWSPRRPTITASRRCCSARASWTASACSRRVRCATWAATTCPAAPS